MSSVLLKTTSKNGTTNKFPTPELSADNTTEEDNDDDEFDAYGELLSLTVVKHKTTLTIPSPIPKTINEEDDMMKNHTKSSNSLQATTTELPPG
ncbi:hypothetical protein C6P40_000487 [Pichia californica]|uniref:Uncharacterized protein n=1 Tax=Pichia californica TaxID=460514 RepID=A0A9P6WPT4_9ASCO|nr:hypothetical protein C6P42_001880 [[Candida] californica]KAG0690989.1 hypothetical protein C6P40_000487 [[Candida] californica]